MKKEYIKPATETVRLATGSDIAESELVVASPSKDKKVNTVSTDNPLSEEEDVVWGLAKDYRSIWE